MDGDTHAQNRILYAIPGGKPLNSHRRNDRLKNTRSEERDPPASSNHPDSRASPAMSQNSPGSIPCSRSHRSGGWSTRYQYPDPAHSH